MFTLIAPSVRTYAQADGQEQNINWGIFLDNQEKRKIKRFFFFCAYKLKQ